LHAARSNATPMAPVMSTRAADRLTCRLSCARSR
jgi:hypothetical protein